MRRQFTYLCPPRRADGLQDRRPEVKARRPRLLAPARHHVLCFARRIFCKKSGRILFLFDEGRPQAHRRAPPRQLLPVLRQGDGRPARSAPVSEQGPLRAHPDALRGPQPEPFEQRRDRRVRGAAPVGLPVAFRRGPSARLRLGQRRRIMHSFEKSVAKNCQFMRSILKNPAFWYKIKAVTGFPGSETQNNLSIYPKGVLANELPQQENR